MAEGNNIGIIVGTANIMAQAPDGTLKWKKWRFDDAN